jgi:protein-disulfide isomerase
LVEIKIVPDNWSPQKRYLGAKAKGKPLRTLTQGPDTAPVTLIKYEDYECPYNALKGNGD